MKLQPQIRQLPPRAATGAFILNSGWSKRDADDATATQIHGMAAGTYPFLRRIPAKRFTRLLATSEIVLGTALLTPVVPEVAAGVGLTVFSAGLIGMYLRTPGMRQPGSLRPTQEGIGLAKDAWILAIGLALVFDALSDPGAGCPA